MKIYNIIISKLFSTIFRFILLLCGGIILYKYDNVFATYVYIVSFLFYISIFYALLLKEGWLSKVRLLNDFAFMAIVLYGKDMNFLTISFLILPILNSPNHSGDKKSILLYVFLIITFLFLSEFKLYKEVVFIVFVFGIINLLVDSKQRYYRNISRLNEVIEDFLESSLELRKSYKIYEGLILKLNEIRGIYLYKPRFVNIICYKIVSDKAVLVNSSKFIWSINSTVLNSRVFINSDQTFKDGNITLGLNNNKSSNNFIVPVKTKSNQYVFVVVLDLETTSSDIFNLYYKNLLKPIFSRVSRVIDLENILKEQNRKVLDDYRNKYFYVQNAEKAMHFIKNRFNSLDNFIEMAKDNINGTMDSEDLKMYERELGNVERNYNLLISRVKTILSKSDKPFSATELELKSPDYLFDIIRNIWFDYFQDFEYSLGWDTESVDKYKVQVNIDGLYILMTDWITNMKKYSAGDEIVIFSETESTLDVTFQNLFTKSNLQIIEELKNDFNSSEKDKILQRTSHGVLIMKSILEEMAVKGSISVTESNIKLNLSFKKKENENSNF